MEEFHSDLTAIWHSFSAPLHLYRNLARIQPVGNQLSWVPSYKGVCCGWFLFIIADWYSSVLRMCLFINSMTVIYKPISPRVFGDCLETGCLPLGDLCIRLQIKSLFPGFKGTFMLTAQPRHTVARWGILILFHLDMHFLIFVICHVVPLLEQLDWRHKCMAVLGFTALLMMYH